MNITQIRYALEVEQTGSISKAARNLYMAQPNLSAAIKELENSMGIRIFTRSSKGVSTTHEGQAFLNEAREIIHQIDGMEARFSQSGPRARALHVASGRQTYVAYALARALSDAPPEIVPRTVEFVESDSMDAILAIAEGNVDLGVCRYAAESSQVFRDLVEERGLSWERIWRYPLCLVLGESHPLAGLDVVPVESLAGYTEVIHGAYRYTIPGQEGRGQKREILVYDRGSRINIVANLQGAFMWNMPVEEETLQMYHLVQKQVDQPTPCYEDYVLYKKGRELTAFERLYTARLKRDCEALMGGQREDGLSP